MPRIDRRTQQVLATVATVALLVLVWWVQGQGQDDDAADRAQDRASSTASPTSPASPTQSGGGEATRPTAGGESARSGELPDRDDDGIPYVALRTLPSEAARTVELIDAGGPFPHPDKDGSTFGNFEGLLPDRQRGYYAEYTVPTPGVSHRGARRIIAGDGGELYWTEDHYESFERIRR